MYIENKNYSKKCCKYLKFWLKQYYKASSKNLERSCWLTYLIDTCIAMQTNRWLCIQQIKVWMNNRDSKQYFRLVFTNRKVLNFHLTRMIKSLVNGFRLHYLGIYSRTPPTTGTVPVWRSLLPWSFRLSSPCRMSSCRVAALCSCGLSRLEQQTQVLSKEASSCHTQIQC